MFHVACTTTWVAEETKLENMKEQQEQMIQQDQFKKMNAQGTSRPARKTAKKKGKSHKATHRMLWLASDALLVYALLCCPPCQH